MADITRPEFLRSTTLGEHLRWQKHTTDNIDRINAPKPFISLARTVSSLTVPTGTITLVPFDTVQLSQGNAPTWSAAEPDTLTISEGGVWHFNYVLNWDTPVSGTLVAERTSNMSVAYASRTAMQWSAVGYQEGTGISWSSGANTRLTFSRAGRVLLATDLILYDTAAGGWRETYWLKNGSTVTYISYDLTPGGTYAGTSGYAELLVAAGDYVELYLYQNQTAAVALNALGTATNPLRAFARYIDSGVSVRSSGLVINDYYGPDRATGALGFVAAAESSSSSYLSLNGSTTLPLVAGDTVKLRALQSSGADLSVLAYPYTELHATRL